MKEVLESLSGTLSLAGKATKIPLLHLGKYNHFFVKNLSPFPVDVSLKVTEKCNSRCITCNVWREQAEKKDLTIEEIESIFHQLKGAKIKTISFYGGEPLLRKDIGDLIRSAKKIIKGVKILIITNAVLLKDKAEEISCAGVDVVCVSLDGIGETDEKIRGFSGHYQKAIEGIRRLKEVDKKNKIQINIGTTILRSNIDQVQELTALADKMGISWSFNLFNTAPSHFNGVEISPELEKIDKSSIEKFISYLDKIRKENPRLTVSLYLSILEFAKKYLEGEKPFFNCILGYLRVYIDSDFNVYSGCWALPPVGNLKKENLKEILGSPTYKERLEKMYKLDCPYCTCGFQINCLVNDLPRTIRHILKDIPLYFGYI